MQIEQEHDHKKKRKPKIIGNYNKQQKNTNEDYVEIKDGKYGLCEIEGIGYNRQEDALITAPENMLEILRIMDDNAIKDSYLEAFEEIQKMKGNIDLMGTTCCSAAAWMEPQIGRGDNSKRNVKTLITNLGDSAAYLVVIKNDSYHTYELHSLHNPNTAKEQQRIANQAFKDENHKKRVLDSIKREGKLPPPSRLGVSRAFGDIDCEQDGVSHIPDIENNNITLDEGETAYLVCGCDGLVETALKPNDLGRIVCQNRHKTLDLIAEALVNAAFNEGRNHQNPERLSQYVDEGSTDNISVGIFEVSEKAVLSITTLDGHGGLYSGNLPGYTDKYSAGQLSKEIGEIFYPTLGKCLDNKVRNTPGCVCKGLATRVPAKQLAEKLQTLFPDKLVQNAVKTELFNYHINNANDIIAAQTALQKTLSADSKNISADVAFSILQNIQYIIFNTQWKVGFFGGIKVTLKGENQTTVVQKKMVEMLNVIQESYNDYKAHNRVATDAWITAYHRVVAIGKTAANEKPFFPFFCFGKQDKVAQQFYDMFNGAQEIPKAEINLN
jgi:serine/threonine protein phosphatase PrpC